MASPSTFRAPATSGWSAALAAALVLLAAASPARAQMARGALSLESAADPPSSTILEAGRGDGIWDLLVRAGVRPTPSAIRAFESRNRGRLMHGNQLVAGRSYHVPAAGSRVATFPIFGPEYERVKRRSSRLAGQVYYVVSGHGGPDPGSIGRYRGRPLPEDEVAYDVALRLARRLIQEGATVHLIVKDPDDGIRDATHLPLDHDEVYTGGKRIPLDQLRRLRERVRDINRLYRKHGGAATVQRVLALHVDARSHRRNPEIDVHFLVDSRRGRRLANELRAAFRERYARAQPGRGYDGTVETRGLYVLRNTRPVAVLIELGDIRNPRDQVRLTRPGNRQAVADWIVDGLLKNSHRRSGPSEARPASH